MKLSPTAMTESEGALDACLDDPQKSRLRSYRSFMQRLLDLGLTPIRHRDFAAEPQRRSVLLVRHDIDHDIGRARRFSELDRSMGIRSSFYLLHPGDYGRTTNYYGTIAPDRVTQAPALIEAAHLLLRDGHEVGLHTDLVQLSHITGRPVGELLAEALAGFRANGVDVVGTAAHGSVFRRRHRFQNFEIFRGCTWKEGEVGRTLRIGEWSWTAHGLDMADFGLGYEAYSLPRDIYVMDSGGNITIDDATRERQPLRLDDEPAIEEFCALIRNIDGPRVQILFHPIWWTFVTGSSGKSSAAILMSSDIADKSGGASS